METLNNTSWMQFLTLMGLARLGLEWGMRYSLGQTPADFFGNLWGERHRGIHQWGYQLAMGWVFLQLLGLISF